MNNNDEKALRKLLAIGEWFTTAQLDAVLLEVWENTYDAGMHCNSLMRRGFIDYKCDGDWKLDITEFELNEITGSNGSMEHEL
jgi:hypothetical protein